MDAQGEKQGIYSDKGKLGHRQPKNQSQTNQYPKQTQNKAAHKQDSMQHSGWVSNDAGTIATRSVNLLARLKHTKRGRRYMRETRTPWEKISGKEERANGAPFVRRRQRYGGYAELNVLRCRLKQALPMINVSTIFRFTDQF